MVESVQTVDAAIRVGFPWYIVWGPLWWLPLCTGLGATLFAWGLGRLAARPFRRACPTHWVEQARLVHAHTTETSSAVIVVSLFVFVYLFVLHDPFVGPLPLAGVTALMLLCAFVATNWAAWRTSPRAELRGIRFGDWLRGWAVWLLLMYPYAVAGVLGLCWALWSPTWSGAPYVAAVLIAAASVGISQLFLLRLFRLLSRPTAHLQQIVDQAAAQCGTTPRAVRILRWRAANAVALPWHGAVLFTDELVNRLDDDAIRAICCHELAHLREPRWMRLLRAAPGFGLALLWAATGWWAWGVVEIGVAVALLYGFIVWGMAKARRFESIADTAAQQGGARQAYARALEQLYAMNLVPVVLHGWAKSHPDLYDRLLAAGHQPAYERPAPPPRGVRWIGSLCILIGAMGLGVTDVMLHHYCETDTARWRAHMAIFGITRTDLHRYAYLLQQDGRMDEAAQWWGIVEQIPAARQ